MAKFKVGDRVERTALYPNHDFRPGERGTVSGVYPTSTGGTYTVSGKAGKHAEANLTLVEAAPLGYETLVNGERIPVLGKEADPTGKDAHTPGAKLDAGKLRPTLVLRDMARALKAVIKIATDGAAKYTPGGWLVVPQGLERYEDADLRHMLERFTGQPVDKDSKSLHLAHEAWNALAKLELHLRKEENEAKSTTA